MQTKVQVKLDQLVPSFESEVSEEDRVTIHYDFDNFEPDFLLDKENSGKFESLRMVRCEIKFLDATQTDQVLCLNKWYSKIFI